MYGIDGYFVDALSGATSIAGDAPTPQPGKATIVVRDDGKTIFNGILTGCMNIDQDGDGKTEAVELWENEITFLMNPRRSTATVGGVLLSSYGVPNILTLDISILMFLLMAFAITATWTSITSKRFR